MSRTRRIIVGVVAMLSLAGIGGVATAATSDDASSPAITATRWCC